MNDDKEKTQAQLIFENTKEKDGTINKELLLNLIQVMKEEGTLSTKVLRELKKIYQHYFDQEKVVITTAAPLEESEKNACFDYFGKLTQFQVDSSIISGVIIQKGWDVLDGSIKTKLSGLLQ